MQKTGVDQDKESCKIMVIHKCRHTNFFILTLI